MDQISPCETKERNPEMPDYEEMKTTGILRKNARKNTTSLSAHSVKIHGKPVENTFGENRNLFGTTGEIADTWELKKDEIIHPLPAYTQVLMAGTIPCGKPIHCS